MKLGSGSFGADTFQRAWVQKGIRKHEALFLNCINSNEGASLDKSKYFKLIS